MRACERLISTEPTPDDVQFVEDRLHDFNSGATGITDGEWLAIFARDEDNHPHGHDNMLLRKRLDGVG